MIFLERTRKKAEVCYHVHLTAFRATNFTLFLIELKIIEYYFEI